MRVEEPLLEETLCSKNMKDTLDELEETLSLCDLPLYSDQSVDWDQDLSLTSNSTSSSSHEDYFEFFSQELNPSAVTDFQPENIVFCGKLIPYKQLSPCKTDSSNQAEIKIQTNHTKKRRWRLKFSSTKNSKRQSTQSKNGNKSTTVLMHQSHKKMYNTNKIGKGHCFPTRRMPIFAAPPPSGKVKWYFFLFGISRFSTMVELRDIRSRQSRRQCRSPPPSSPPPPPMFGFRNGDDKVSDRRWGLWGLIRALSCGGNHLPTTVVAGGSSLPE